MDICHVQTHHCFCVTPQTPPQGARHLPTARMCRPLCPDAAHMQMREGQLCVHERYDGKALRDEHALKAWACCASVTLLVVTDNTIYVVKPSPACRVNRRSWTCLQRRHAAGSGAPHYVTTPTGHAWPRMRTPSHMFPHSGLCVRVSYKCSAPGASQPPQCLSSPMAAAGHA